LTGNDGFWRFLLSGNYTENSLLQLSSLPLTFEDANYNPSEYSVAGGNITRLPGNLTRWPVELQIQCNSSKCETTAIRNSNFFNSTALQSDFYYVVLSTLLGLTTAFPDSASTSYPSVFEVFLNNPLTNPFNASFDEDVDLYNVSATELALRLEQIVNTYWIARMAESGIVSFDQAVMSRLSADGLMANTTATTYNWAEFLSCDIPWLVVLCIVTIVMFIAAAFSVVFTILYNGPEAQDFLSALVRSHGLPELNHGSYLQADKVIRKLKDLELKVGDARPEKEVGRIVIGPSERLGSLQKGRLYE
jgi:hypothetical protein